MANNAERDQAISKTIAALNQVKLTLAALEERIRSHREQAEIQLATLGKETERVEQVSLRLQETQEDHRERLNEANKGLAELKTDYVNLKKRVEDDRVERRRLWVGLVLAVLAALLGLGKDWVAAAFRK